MPYITPERRKKLDANPPTSAGELNYRLTKECLAYLERKGESYATYNDILGVLAAIPHEIYRRRIAPYEEKKIIENGDV